jgi:hypothetical protein
MAQVQVTVSAPAPPPIPLPLPPVLNPPSVPYPQPVVMTPMPQQPPMAPGPLVELRTNDINATLFRLSGEGVSFGWSGRHRYVSTYDTWSPVCHAPCGIVVNPSDVYTIRGRHIVPSDSFQVPERGVISLTVDAGHRGPRAGGVLLTVFGGIGVGLGAIFTPIGSALGGQLGGSTTNATGTAFLTTGVSMLAVGGTMLVGGIVVLALTKTTVHSSDGFRFAAIGRTPRLYVSAAGLHF